MTAQLRVDGFGCGDAQRPVVVVGAHSQSLFMHVDQMPREGETVTAHGYAETLDGGKATNQAVAAARFGAPTRFVSIVGSDERGQRIVRYLEAQRVDRRWVVVVDGPTDVGFVMLSPRRIPAIASCLDLSQRLDAGFVEKAADAIRGASIVVCQLEAPPSCAIAAFTMAQRQGATTLLNPAPAVPIPTELLRLTDILVPNQHEAAAIAGRDASVADLAAYLADEMPRSTVIVTAGADGAYIGRAGQRTQHVRAPSVDAIDTTGAGDAFVGALAARLRAGVEVDEAASLAVRAAALSVTRSGTLGAFARFDEV
jgi:ribokinase